MFEKEAEEYICNGKCQDDITKNYAHCKTCGRIKDFVAGYKEALKVKVNTTTISDAPLMEMEQLEQTEEMKNKCSTLLDKLYLSGLKPNQVALVERMQDVLGV